LSGTLRHFSVGCCGPYEALIFWRRHVSLRDTPTTTVLPQTPGPSSAWLEKSSGWLEIRHDRKIFSLTHPQNTLKTHVLAMLNFRSPAYAPRRPNVNHMTHRLN